MALVRCPVHKIPYNDDQPRGCPACASEKEGDQQHTVIRELAKASKALHRAAVPESGEADASADADTGAPADATRPDPRAGVAAAWRRLSDAVARRPTVWLGAGLAVVILAIWLAGNAGARFVPTRLPPSPAAQPRPLLVQPNAPVSLAFAALGVRQPRAHPQNPILTRYAYGADLVVDALNDVVYEISVAVPGRSWRGISVGLAERAGQGALALLGQPREAPPPAAAAGRVLEGYVVYPPAQLPQRSHTVEVRPPNGCFDVIVDVQPQIIGLLIDGEQRWAAVSRRGDAAEWVVTRIRVTSRALAGQDRSRVVC